MNILTRTMNTKQQSTPAIHSACNPASSCPQQCTQSF